MPSPMTVQEVFDNWSAYLRDVDRDDFKAQLALLVSSEKGETSEVMTMTRAEFAAALGRAVVADRKNAAPQVTAGHDSPASANLTPRPPAVAARDGQFDKWEKAPTPRTDAEVINATFPDADLVAAGFCRMLEREVAELQHDLARALANHNADLSARGDIERLERELAALRLLKDMDALEASAFGTFLKGGDIPATIDAARGALMRRMLEGEAIIRALVDPNNVNPVDGDDVKAMLRFGKATDAARAFLHKSQYVGLPSPKDAK